MIFLGQANILTIGLNGETESLQNLPMNLMKAEGAADAVSYIKTEHIDAVICRWDLPDMPNGIFLKRLRALKPQIKTIVIIKAGNTQDEISARCMGASAVLTDHSSEDILRQTVIDALKLYEYSSANVVRKRLKI